MEDFDEQLKALSNKITVKNRLSKLVRELNETKANLETDVNELHTKMIHEQNDVDRLEGSSLTGAFYDLIGKKDEKMAKERFEAETARENYDDAVAELADIKERIAKFKTELSSFQGCEEEYQILKKRKLAVMLESNPEFAQRIENIDNDIEEMKQQKIEISEACQAGMRAQAIVEEILGSLGNANTWGMVDMFSDSFLVDLAKHHELDRSQALVADLQAELKNFEDELNDIHIADNLQISVDGFSRMADYWIDNIFTDWMIMDHIHNSQGKIQEIANQLSNTISKLQRMQNAADQVIDKLKLERDRLINETKLG